MKTYIQGLITGFLLSSTAILLMGAGDDKGEAGRYEYYISTDDITKKHYSRIFDTATGVVYHKQFTPGGDQTDIQWVNENELRGNTLGRTYPYGKVITGMNMKKHTGKIGI